MVIEFGRHVLGSEDSNSTEFDRSTPHPVIDLLPEQRGIGEMGGTMRLGLYPCEFVEGTLAQSTYESASVFERHRHRYEFNNTYREFSLNMGWNILVSRRMGSSWRSLSSAIIHS